MNEDRVATTAKRWGKLTTKTLRSLIFVAK
jgi:hypothetical protein